MKSGHVQIRHDSFWRLNVPMIVHDSFKASGFIENGLKHRSNRKWRPRCYRPRKNKPMILTTVTPKARKWKKIAKIQRTSPQDRTWSVSLICRLIAESMFVENFLTRHRKCWPQRHHICLQFYAIGEWVPVSSVISSRGLDNYHQITQTVWTQTW